MAYTPLENCEQTGADRKKKIIRAKVSVSSLVSTSNGLNIYYYITMSSDWLVGTYCIYSETSQFARRSASHSWRHCRFDNPFISHLAP